MRRSLSDLFVAHKKITDEQIDNLWLHLDVNGDGDCEEQEVEAFYQGSPDLKLSIDFETFLAGLGINQKEGQTATFTNQGLTRAIKLMEAKANHHWLYRPGMNQWGGWVLLLALAIYTVIIGMLHPDQTFFVTDDDWLLVD